MNTKLAKENAIAIGIISAISVLPLLADIPANAQTDVPQNNTPSQTNTPSINPSPNQVDPSLNQTDPSLNQPSQNTQPVTPSNLSNYSVDRAPMLKLGSLGQAVRDVQSFLSQQGIYNGPVDGIYGVQTRQAVMAYQRSRNLLADGIIGNQTWGIMLGQQNQASS